MSINYYDSFTFRLYYKANNVQVVNLLSDLRYSKEGRQFKSKTEESPQYISHKKTLKMSTVYNSLSLTA